MQVERLNIKDAIKAKTTVTGTDTKEVTAGTQTFAEADRKKGGRPKKDPSEKISNNRLTIYLSDEELHEIEKLSKRVGMTPQSLIKFATFNYVDQNKKD
jgi:hypothetical protein